MDLVKMEVTVALFRILWEEYRDRDPTKWTEGR